MFHTLTTLSVDKTVAVRNVVIGKGEGISIGLAKKAAATQGLQYLRTYGIPPV
jgi:hypothetical protein